MNRRFLLLPALVFLAVAVFSGIQLFRLHAEYRAGETVYEDAAQFVSPSETDDELLDAPADTAPTDDIDWPQVDFAALRSQSSDVVGWIYLPDSKINYPIVQGKNNSYYLKRLYDGSHNSSGSIFLDYRNAADFSDVHSVLYGHHMNNGSMFAGIAQYKQQEYYDTHPYCLLLTPEGNYKVHFFAGYVASVETDLQAWDLSFADSNAYAGWLQEAIARSTFISDAEVTAEDRILTLSTCSYEFDNARYVLVGVIE